MILAQVLSSIILPFDRIKLIKINFFNSKYLKLYVINPIAFSPLKDVLLIDALNFRARVFGSFWLI
jgi:hypothetical protein